MLKKELHPRNRHRGRYDFKALARACPELSAFITRNPSGDETIDFANPKAVKALNRAILKAYYHVSDWDIPEGYLCPPIPGRADYLHHVADLLAESNQGTVPRGEKVRALDIGCGANCVYPLIGQAEYGWSFVGTDIDAKALESARMFIGKNPALAPRIELRLQESPARVFEGVIRPDDFFALTVCNPPFHASLEEAQAGSSRKWRNLGKAPSKKGAPLLNFGGAAGEIWCEGGERSFILRMIQESAPIARQCFWFSTLVSKEVNLPVFMSTLEQAGATDARVLEMAQGQKKSRILAWTYAARGATSGQRVPKPRGERSK